MAIGIEDQVQISPPTWPAVADVPPGDLTRFAPIGLGLAAPAIVRPWDTLEGALVRGSFYSAHESSANPILNAPINDDTGGVVYLNGHVTPDQLVTLFSLLGVMDAATDYAVFAAESPEPHTDRYLAQLRIVLYDGLTLFGARLDVNDSLVQQKLNTGDLIRAFIVAQRKVWDGSAIAGTLGGDGDWAKESLAFGFMVENAYNGVYRIWSRPWLVTK